MNEQPTTSCTPALIISAVVQLLVSTHRNPWTFVLNIVTDYLGDAAADFRNQILDGFSKALLATVRLCVVADASCRGVWGWRGVRREGGGGGVLGEELRDSAYNAQHVLKR